MKFIIHKDLDIPHGNTVIWRFMGLDKFLDLLTHKRLFFTNAKNLTDEYEMSIPTDFVEKKRNQLTNKGFSGRELEEELIHFQYFHRPMRDLTLVNCWSIGKVESYALWKIYLSGSKAGVAIRTNVSSLKQALVISNEQLDEEIFISKINYSNYLKEQDLSRFRLITTKREFYKYENEVRLFILEYPDSEMSEQGYLDFQSGMYINVDIDKLIGKLYLSPFVGSWFNESIVKIIEKVSPELKDKILSSSIRDQ
jgi:hypothetical protein